MSESLAEAMRKRHPDTTDREAELFEHLWRVWPYIPANLIDLETGTSVRAQMNDWMEARYGWRFTEPRSNREGASATQAQEGEG